MLTVLKDYIDEIFYHFLVYIYILSIYFLFINLCIFYVYSFPFETNLAQKNAKRNINKQNRFSDYICTNFAKCCSRYAIIAEDELETDSKSPTNFTKLISTFNKTTMFRTAIPSQSL